MGKDLAEYLVGEKESGNPDYAGPGGAFLRVSEWVARDPFAHYEAGYGV